MHTPNLFIRLDLTLEIRLFLAYLLICQNRRGLIRKLCGKYNVSRTFLYNLRNKYSDLLLNLDSSSVAINDIAPLDGLSLMLSLRMEGKCSLEGIHAVMSRLGYRGSSVGHISEQLKVVGSKLGAISAVSEESVQKYVVFCCDEIFSRSVPILISVEPLSLYILKIELAEKRDSETWEAHWKRLISDGYSPIYLVKDEGSAMSAAHEATFEDVSCQSDTFHAVAHRLGLEYKKLEKAAYNCIEKEYACLDLWKKSKSEKCAKNRQTKYLELKEAANTAINLFDNFAFLYHCLLDCFQVFDSQGKLKDLKKTTDNFTAALDLLKTLGRNSLNDQVKAIENCKENLFHFFQIAANVVEELSQSIDNQTLQQLCLAWQVNKNAQKVKRNPDRKNALKRKEKHILALVEQQFQEQYQPTKENAYALLDTIIQSSAAVECINSILRPYLQNSKNNISQEFLNLFAFYHNNRRFYAGKRKGKTPTEILTKQQTNNDWIELIKLKIAA